jgi:hypothetical protein
MATQENYTESLPSNSKRYSVSRVATIPTDELLFAVEPADFGFTVNDNIEIHFYSKLTAGLVFSQRIDLTDDILGIRTIDYVDNKFRNYITFDFNKYIELYPLKISPGDYEIVINIFSDEIGNYNDKKMLINAVSDSRTEVNLRFKDITETNLLELNEFVKPAISKPYLDGILQNIFITAGRQSNQSIGVTIQAILGELSAAGEAQDLTRTEQLGRLGEVQALVANLLETVYKRIQQILVSYPTFRVTEEEAKLIIERVFFEEFNKVRDSLRSDIILT